MKARRRRTGDVSRIAGARVGVNAVDEAIIWAQPERAEFSRRVADAAGLDVVGAGGPGKTRSGATAQAFGTEPVEDLRSALTNPGPSVILIADAGTFGTRDTNGDAEAVLAAQARGAAVVCLDPVPASALAMTGNGWLKNKHGRRALDAIRFVPLAQDHAVLAAMGEVLSDFGPVQMAHVRACGPAESNSLGAALFSGLSLLQRVSPDIEMLDTSVAASDRAELPGPLSDRLRDLSGHAAVLARTAQGTTGTVFASDRTAEWVRSVELLGPAGRCAIDEHGFKWVSPTGEDVESDHRPYSPRDDGAASIAGAIRRHLDGPTPNADATATTLTLASAALLSARTGGPESPAAIARAGLI
jgi:hypothetical protein